MPGVAAQSPVSLSFANNFWGKDDAGVGPMLQRMHDAKTTCEELRAFYTTRHAIEDEFARKLLALSKRALGSTETGSLKKSLDVTRLEVESMAKAHQNIANQMKTELEEPLTAFAGAMRERRKIVQGGCEKILKLKMQQTQQVNKTRDRYEQDCLKIKGYLAQGHMVMGQEEKKNKARLEKAQVALTSSNAEYETAIKALEETTGRWNRDWKAACDKFQDLEEERIDFLKSSCWTFANIASTVCVSDDASCEKIRIALEDCEVEKDIITFITEKGTGQEIPDPPKYINFCRGDISDDSASEAADDNYRLAQFTRNGNPTYRSSSPNPSVSSSQAADPRRSSADHNADLALQKRETRLERRDSPAHRRREIDSATPPSGREVGSASRRRDPHQAQSQGTPSKSRRHDRREIEAAPHNEYPLDGMTMYCRPGNMISDGSSNESGPRPGSSNNESEYSNPTTVSGGSDMSQAVVPSPKDDRQMKRRSFFSSGGPFRRKSKTDKDQQPPQLQQHQSYPLQQRRAEVMRTGQQDVAAQRPSPSHRNTWSPAHAQSNGRDGYSTSSRQSRHQSPMMISDERHQSPEPIDPRASLALNVGGNVFDVSAAAGRGGNPQQKPQEEEVSADPIAQALEELKGVTKNTMNRNSADRFFGLATPAPPSATPGPASNSAVAAAQRGTPPPQYANKASALDLPPPAFTSAQMQQTTQRYVNQRENLLEGPPQMPAVARETPSRQSSRSRSIDYQRPQSSHQQSREIALARDDPNRATSPTPTRSVSPRPQLHGDAHYRNNSPKPQNTYSRAASPNPYTQSRPGTASSNRPGQYAAYNGGSSPGQEVALAGTRGASPTPSHHSRHDSYNSRSRSRADSIRGGYGSNSGRHSIYGGDQAGAVQMYQGGGGQVSRPRSKSVAENRQYSRDGRPILQYSRAMYHYTAVIPEELSFAKGDILAVLRLQDDGWWEAEVVGVNGRVGLVPSNYLQQC